MILDGCIFVKPYKLYRMKDDNALSDQIWLNKD